MHLCWNLVQEWIFKSSNKWILLLHELKKPKARFWGFGRFLEKKSTFCGFWVTSNVHFSDALLVRYFGWNDWCVTFPQNWVINYFFKRYFCVTVKHVGKELEQDFSDGRGSDRDLQEDDRVVRVPQVRRDLGPRRAAHLRSGRTKRCLCLKLDGLIFMPELIAAACLKICHCMIFKQIRLISCTTSIAILTTLLMNCYFRVLSMLF